MNTTVPGVPEKKGVHPGLVVGAIAVVVFGAAGAASYLGLLPGGAPQAPATPVGIATPAQQAGVVPDAAVPPAAAPAAAPEPAPVAAAPAQAPMPSPQPAPEQAVPAPQPAPVQAAPAPLPRIISIHTKEAR